MISSIPDIPKKEKITPRYLTPEIQTQKAFISSLVAAISTLVGNLAVNVHIPEQKEMAVTINPNDLSFLKPEKVEIPSSVRVNNLDGLATLLVKIEKLLEELKAKESPELEIPEFPSEIKVSNFPETKQTDLSRVIALLEDLNTRISAVEPKESVRVENIKDIQIPQVDYDLITNIVASLRPDAPKELDLSVFEEIKKAVQLVATPMPSFIDPDGDPNRAKVDSNRVMRTSSDGYKKLITYNVAGKVEYIGMALAGTATSSPNWQIQKLTYDGSNRLVSVLFSQGTDKFTSVWDDKSTYSYS